MPKHLKILAKSNSDKLNDHNLLETMVNELIKAVGMRPLGDALIVDVPLEIAKLDSEIFEDEGGISIIRMLSTSHIALHAWPLREEIHIELYSCREYAQEDFLRAIAKYLPISKAKISDLTESCEWDD